MSVWKDLWFGATRRQPAASDPYDLGAATDPSTLRSDDTDLYIEDRQTLLNAKGQVDALLYKIWLKDDDGVLRPYYKAVKLGRITRVPVWLREDVRLMDLQDDILAGAWESGINYITMVANIVRPEPLGLVQSYGVQVLGDTAEEVRYYVEHDYQALTAMLTGSFRGIEYRPLTAPEARWIRDKLATMRHLIMLRGIPAPRNHAALATMSSVIGGEDDSQTEEQMEQFVRGMSMREFIFLLVASPMDIQSLKRWLTIASQELTRWSSQMKGSRVISAGVSLPLAYTAQIGSAAGSTHGLTQGESYGVNVQHGESVGLAHSLTTSQQVTHGESSGYNIGQNTAVGASSQVGQSAGTGYNVGIQSSETVGQSASHNTGWSMTESVGQSQAHSVGETLGISAQSSQTQGVSAQWGISQSHTTGTSLTSTEGLSVGQSQSQSVSHQAGETFSQQTSVGQTVGKSLTDTSGVGISSQFSTTASQGASDSHTQGSTSSQGLNVSSTAQSSLSQSAGQSLGGGVNDNLVIAGGNASFNASHADGASNSVGHSLGSSQTVGQSNSSTSGYNASVSHGASAGESAQSSVAQGTQDSLSSSSSRGLAQNWSTGVSDTAGTSQNISQSVAQGLTASNTQGASAGIGQQWSQSTGTGLQASDSSQWSQGTSQGLSYGTGQSWSTGTSQSVSAGTSQSDSWSNQVSQAAGRSLQLGTSKGYSFQSSASESQGVSEGTTASQTQSASQGQSWQNQQSVANSSQISDSLGSGSSLSVGPFLSLSKSFQWEDAAVANLVEIMQRQRERLLKALQGQAAMYADVYILTDSSGDSAAAAATAKTAFYGDVFPQPIEVMTLAEAEQIHQRYHAEAFSACNQLDTIPGILDAFRYSTVLLPREMAAYTHPLRIEIGGATTVAENIPVFRIVPDRAGEVLHGYQISGERWHPDTGYVTPYPWRISQSEIHHTLVAGRARSGKTVGAMRFVYEAYSKWTWGLDAETGEPKRLSVIALDWKQDWRNLKRLIPADRFRFFSLADPRLSPIRFNVLAVPEGIYPDQWIHTVISAFLMAFSMGGRAKAILDQHLTELYTKYDVFNTPENSRLCTMYELWALVDKKAQEISGAGGDGKRPARVGNDTKDAYQRVLDRLSYFAKPTMRQLYGDTSTNALTITDLVQAPNTVTVLEGAGLDAEMKQFVIGVITGGVYHYAKWKGRLDPGILLVYEEAHQVIKGAGKDAGGSDTGVLVDTETIYEALWNEGVGLGLVALAVAQLPSRLPPSIIANSGLLYAYGLDTPDDRQVVMDKIARDARYDHREIARFMPRMPIGWCIAKSSRVFNYLDAEPALVQTLPLDTPNVSNAELMAEVDA